MKKVVFGTLGSVIVAGALILNPYSMNFANEKFGEKTAEAKIPYKRDLLFVSDKNTDGSLETVASKKIKNVDTTVKKAMKVNIKNKKDKVAASSVSEYEDLAYNVEEVRNDKKLQKELSKAIKSGSKVYLYGGVTFEEYKELLDIKEVAIKKEGKKLRFDVNEKEEAKQKGGLKNNPNALTSEDDYTYDVIGYTLDEKEHNQLMISTISVAGAENEEIPTDYYAQEILDSTAETVDVEEQKYTASLESKSIFNWFKPETAKASSKIVKSSSSRVFGNAYWAGSKVGWTVTDWVLHRANSDGDKKYDYFFVEDNTTITTAAGWRADKLKTDHDIPYKNDYIRDWDPGDDSSSPYSISLSAPYGVSFGFNMSGNPKVNDIGSQQYDYGRWEVTNTKPLSTTGMKGVRFEPHTSWRSYAPDTLAVANIQEWGYFSRSGIKASSHVKMKVSYSY
ncbi:hypothetical protein ACQKGD_26040 [Peribacillus frigoritolerans]|uniref:hypothetical protein n=1 Tax=Peribacillus frigoritolerans TaxID=450367 RepID=UPI00207968DD|nr:hypothetical protein [Peribacillus frigoritolerans]USK64475.1 hypothetical protein LIT26_25545 [Peribacillus frigoritolerans]